MTEAAAEWGCHAEELGQLDALLGDGDMGVTAALGSNAMARYLAGQSEDDIGKLIMDCGTAVNRACPSTFGTLLSSALLGGGRAILGRPEIDIRDLVAVGRGAIDDVRRRGKAQVGDKTLLDCLVPGVEGLERAVRDGADNNRAIEAALAAAKAGMEATIHMKAKLGRASYRHDGGVGIQDPGATAMYYLIQAFGRSLLRHGDRQVATAHSRSSPLSTRRDRASGSSS
ncbi:MAG: dihydroxyacetone kinase subunit L [Candidatus Limnocylindrales bacterium]|jgi:dihydroxyacetone kinase-like protein